jgi:hypothetical protein
VWFLISASTCKSVLVSPSINIQVIVPSLSLPSRPSGHPLTCKKKAIVAFPSDSKEAKFWLKGEYVKLSFQRKGGKMFSIVGGEKREKLNPEETSKWSSTSN